MPLSKGDFILVEYTAKVKETGQVIETTSEEEAKKAKIYEEGRKYGPLLIILGEGRVIQGFEEQLLSSDVGEEKEVEIPPEKAYGVRDPNKIRIVPLRELRKHVDVSSIVPGAIVNINGVPAVIRSVTGGRVIVDFNHPLAGKTLIYRFKIIKKIEDEKEKIKYLLHRQLRGIEPDKFEVERKDDSIVIEMPSEALFIENVQYIKSIVAGEIFKYVDPNLKVVKYVESFEKSKGK